MQRWVALAAAMATGKCLVLAAACMAAVVLCVLMVVATETAWAERGDVLLTVRTEHTSPQPLCSVVRLQLDSHMFACVVDRLCGATRVNGAAHTWWSVP